MKMKLKNKKTIGLIFELPISKLSYMVVFLKNKKHVCFFLKLLPAKGIDVE